MKKKSSNQSIDRGSIPQALEDEHQTLTQNLDEIKD
jgi:hypothetical protein